MKETVLSTKVTEIKFCHITKVNLDKAKAKQNFKKIHKNAKHKNKFVK